MDADMLGWVIQEISAVTLAAVFALGAWHKVRGYPRFVASLEAYRLFPQALTRLVAPVVVFTECAAAGLSLTGWGPGSLLGFVLLGLYTGAIALNLARGRSDIDCGCGEAATPLSGWLLGRNGVLMGLALLGSSGYAAADPAGWWVVAGGALLMLLAYQSLEQLLANLALATTPARPAHATADAGSDG
ncbi:MAG: MauE/DoxX family redox-associated membrane protein [Pseudomonadales bacterium]